MQIRTSLAIAVCTTMLMTATPGVAQQLAFPSDTIAVVKDDAPLSNAEIAVAMSRETSTDPVPRVVIGRDDAFADALASGVLQATDPLLLVPPAGPIPEIVTREITRLAPSAAVVLGGERAVSPAVVTELETMGMSVRRLAGGTRFDTAIAVAADAAPGADTVILARAFESAGSTDPSQAFADTLAGGGMAARTGWPVLLTDTARLTPATRDYMLASGVQQVEILGGTAAISAEVEAELQAMGITTERLSGPSRADTALAIADKLGAPTAADADRVMLVQGQTADAWAGGFAAALHAATFDAPIVLATGDTLPPATRQWLAAGDTSSPTFAQDPQGVRITCVTLPNLCEQARLELGLPPAGGGSITTDPPAGSTVDAAQPIRATITSVPAGQVDEVLVRGTCLGPDNLSNLIRPDGTGPLPGNQIVLSVSAAVPAGPCEFEVHVRPSDGPELTTTIAFTASGRSRIDLLSAGPDGTGVGGRQPSTSADGSVVAFTSDGQVLAGVPGGTHHVYAVVDGVTELVDVAPDGGPGEAACSNCGSPNLAVSADGGSVVFTSIDEALDPSGPQVVGSLLGAYVRDLARGTTTLVSYDTTGEPISVNEVDIDGDGSVVVYQGQGRAPSPSATSGRRTGFYVFWRDAATSTVGVIANPATGEPVTVNSSDRAELSADGRWIAFTTDEALVAADTNTGHDTYVFDRQTGALEVVSVGPGGRTGNTADTNGGNHRGISRDGRHVAFESASTDLLDGVVVPAGAVYVRDRVAGTTTLVSRRADDSPPVGARAGRVQMSADGTHVAFVVGEDLANHDEAGCGVYRFTVATAELVRVDIGEVEHGPANCPYGIGVADSGHVVFDEFSTHHVDADPANEADVYRWNPS